MGKYAEVSPAMPDCSIRITQSKTGWEVRVDDPEIMKANRTAKGSYRDPTQEYTFKTAPEVVKFVTGAMRIIEQKADTYSSVFDKLVKDENKED